MTKTEAQEPKPVAWHVSTYSDSSGGSCVEASPVAGAPRVAVRDTKAPARGHLTVPRTAWATFLHTVTR